MIFSNSSFNFQNERVSYLRFPNFLFGRGFTGTGKNTLKLLLCDVSSECYYRSQLSFLYSGIDWLVELTWVRYQMLSKSVITTQGWAGMISTDNTGPTFSLLYNSWSVWPEVVQCHWVSVDSTHISSGYPPSVRWDSVRPMSWLWSEDPTSVSGNQSPGEVRWEGAQEQDGELLPSARGGGSLPWAPAETRHWPGVEKVSPLRASKYFALSFVNILTVQ